MIDSSSSVRESFVAGWLVLCLGTGLSSGTGSNSGTGSSLGTGWNSGTGSSSGTDWSSGTITPQYSTLQFQVNI